MSQCVFDAWCVKVTGGENLVGHKTWNGAWVRAIRGYHVFQTENKDNAS